MAKLIFKRFGCKDVNDFNGNDSPYFLTYVGDLSTGVGRVKRTRFAEWEDEVDENQTWNVNQTIVNDFGLVPSKTIAMAAVIEEDGNADISDADRALIEASMNAKLADYVAGGLQNFTSGTRSEMWNRFKTQVNNHLSGSLSSGDDYLGVRHIPLQGSTGLIPTLTFLSSAGHYLLRYEQQ